MRNLRPSHMCDAALDFVMDVLAGFIIPEGYTFIPPVYEIHSDLVKKWSVQGPITSRPMSVHPKVEERGVKVNELAKQFHTIYVVCLREVRRFNRTLGRFTSDCIVMYLLGSIIAGLFGFPELGQCVAPAVYMC
jgi:hypothetical protein